MDKVIYIPLLGEGTDCWRPVHAQHIAEDVFRIASEAPDGENWAFAPGSKVQCRNKVFADGKTGLVACAYAKGDSH